MRVLVTGATGKVGGAVARAALAAGHEVRALVRDVARASTAFPPGIELVSGDVLDPPALAEACADRELVYNAMGVPEQWLADPALFDRVNVQGSANLAQAAAAAKVARMVHTSTINVFDAPRDGLFDETNLAVKDKGTPYQRSKQRAEKAVLAASGHMEVVFANSATVYGLGPTGYASLETQMFRPVLRGLLPAVPPGGFGVVFTEGLAQGHLLAAEYGRPGERYIFCDEHATVARLTRTVVEVAGRGRAPVATIPAPVMTVMAAAGEAVARITRRPPPIAHCQLQYLLWNATPDSSKAQKELGWLPTPLAEGIRRTIVETGL
ncbi:NAD-dependent epimerase/dehydratase family protein [Pseudofrankia sp. BMG5.37]|uniref:NAD-dependent epimerase/dehydratase family protein n=1 Tax=Pseudofrankia sp. BMG5.37 TaxID=3050035 RepID=UPI0028951380|nr:NAD-dependent epimerase/dehydratase family protein [Pseudofrankia sp. BMG5.37]MDT3440269.1 NAD-dependent epimerase/dehydratase family protein [Pseudofrankia sp. BMG5.37]